MNVRGVKIPFRACSWFADKGKLGEWILEAKNVPEREKRLQWLSEGCLEYHMSDFTSEVPTPQGIPAETALWRAFIDHLGQGGSDTARRIVGENQLHRIANASFKHERLQRAIRDWLAGEGIQVKSIRKVDEHRAFNAPHYVKVEVIVPERVGALRRWSGILSKDIHSFIRRVKGVDGDYPYTTGFAAGGDTVPLWFGYGTFNPR